MPDAERKWSLLWWLCQEGWELFWQYCEPLTAMELESESLKSVLVPKLSVRIGWVATTCSFVQHKNWACFLYHLMPKNARTAIKMPKAEPTQMLIMTKKTLWTIVLSLMNLRQWKHLAGKTDAGFLFQISPQSFHKTQNPISRTKDIKIEIWSVSNSCTIYLLC